MPLKNLIIESYLQKKFRTLNFYAFYFMLDNIYSQLPINKNIYIYKDAFFYIIKESKENKTTRSQTLNLFLSNKLKKYKTNILIFNKNNHSNTGFFNTLLLFLLRLDSDKEHFHFIFFLLLCLITDEDFYVNNISLVADIAALWNFNSDMIEDFINAIKMGICNKPIKDTFFFTEESKIFFRSKSNIEK